jgi:steroid 5-alpha reductase family enzyme
MTALTLLITLLATGAALLVLQGVTFVVALKAGKHSVVDTAWGIGIALAALAAFLVSLGHGDPARRALLLAASVLWGLRLAAYVGWRNHGKPEDPRYADMLRGRTNLYALRMVYLLQAAILWLATVPVQLGMLERSPAGPLAVAGPVVGTVLFAAGFAFESIGDWQLARFKATAADGQIMDRGLWRYTRHPNYFGDFCMWWGLFAISAGSWRALVALAGPLLMSFILTRGTGARMTDRRMTASRPQYADYVARTSGFIPLPPKRAAKRAPERSAAAAAPGERA